MIFNSQSASFYYNFVNDDGALEVVATGRHPPAPCGKKRH